MFFFTETECDDWCRQHGVPVTRTQANEGPAVRVELSVESAKLLATCRQIVASIGPWEASLLRVVLTDVWPSSTNLHPYYTLKKAYGDGRLVRDAPGHLFLSYEHADLVTFLQLGVLFGWEMDLRPDLDYGRAFVSHDGWVKIQTSEETAFLEIEEQFNAIGCTTKVIREMP